MSARFELSTVHRKRSFTGDGAGKCHANRDDESTVSILAEHTNVAGLGFNGLLNPNFMGFILWVFFLLYRVTFL